MGTKGVFLLGLIVCWTAVCNGEYGFMFNSRLNDEFKKEVADENLILFSSAVGDDCVLGDETTCGTRQKCDEKTKKCACLDGLSGTNCEEPELCKTDKFKDCKGENGTCEYIDDTKETVCSCKDDTKKVHPVENRCRVPCTDATECENGGTCDGEEDPKFCSCKSGLYGDKCEKVSDCIEGKYKGCEKSDGTCTYEGNKAICTCTGDKKLDDTQHICRVPCKDETECKNGVTCEGADDAKFCSCKSGLYGDKCEKISDCLEGKYKGCEKSDGTCTYEDNKAICTCTGDKKLDDKEHICKDCECEGEHRVCSFKNGIKNCDCEQDFKEKADVCTECKCAGAHEICSFDGEKKLCNCKPGFTKKNGVCTAICSKDTECTERGKCKGATGSKTCECDDGLSGDKCDKMDWCEGNGKFKNCKGVNGTCKYVKENRAVDCICPPGKILDKSRNENRCRDTCSTSAPCKNGGTCLENFCFCFAGYIGDRCEIVFDCTDKGKLKGCEASGGTCDLEGSKAVCSCPVDQKYNDKEHACKECTCGPHGTCKFVNGEKKCDCARGFGDKEGICTATCTTPADCKDNQTCGTVDTWKTCVCASGLGGSDCEKLSWCGSRFKNCKGVNGTCEYVKDKRSVYCTCTSEKALHPRENRCREKCKDNSDCQNAGSCEENFCSCKLGVMGDKCETVLDCMDTGKYKGCKSSGGNCTHDGNNVVCKCGDNKAYHDTEHMCKECNCGANGVCRFDNGQKKCDCKKNFAEKNGICIATCTTNEDCKDDQKCAEQNDWKSCVCADGLSGDNCNKNDWCDGKFKNCKGVNGTCKYDKSQRSVVCNCDSGKALNPAENRCRETCNGETDCKNKGKCENNFCSCHEGFVGDKCETIFDCTSEGKYKFCVESGGTCSHDDSKTVCACPQGKKLHETENICKGECTGDDDCKNGGWCVIESKLCNCEPGLTGDNCEIVIECEANGKYKGCKSSGGTCSYESSDAVCKCPNNQKYHTKEHTCKATCNKDEDCEKNQKCAEKDGWKSCMCADGLSGKNCDKLDWCDGKFKNCKGSNGTCGYNPNRRTIECTCTSGKALHPNENRCRDTCNTNSDCKNTGTCGNNFCTCKVGVFGDKCETVFDCESTGKYSGCKNSGGTCIYDGNNAVCNCPENKKLHDIEHKCKECNCGSQGTCKFENGAKKCVCAPGFAERNGICTATCEQNTDCKDNQKCGMKDSWKTCVCADGLNGDNCGNNDWCSGKFKNCKGANGTCAYNKDKRAVECTCPPGKALNSAENRCRETCTGEDCKNGGKCEKSKFCSCKLGIIGDKCETIFECSAGKYKNCASSGGTCKIVDNKAVCECPGHKIFHDTEGICKEFCTTNEECNGGQCQGADGKKICLCKKGLKGDKCQTVTDCDDGKYSKCVSTGGECTFDGTQAKCTCPGSKLLDSTLNICREKCKNDCKNGGVCVAELCRCIQGTSGDKCDNIDGCENLKCGEKDADCKFDKTERQAYCECKDKNYYFEENQCKPTFCNKGCSAESDCEFNKGVGVCKCKKEGTYYDYTTGNCLPIDKCFNKACGTGEVCKDGNCVCDDNHQLKEKKCEAKDFCDKNMGKCFDGAQCEKSNPLGFVKCICKDPQFYNPRTRKCEDISCFSPKEKKNCKTTCPGEMERSDGVCKHKTDKTKCDKPCGTLGWCYKYSETSQNCVCEPNVAELDSTAGKCVLKATAVCPTTERNGEDKCKCTGKYKPSANGITCELKSCADQDVKDDCRKKGADRCVDNWTGDGYKCMCPFGYIESTEKGCIDPCSMDSMKTDCLNKGQVCYIGSKDKKGDCRCLPTFTPNSARTSCEPSGKNTVMIHSLPILSKKYESPDKNINKVLLNIDVTNSMAKAFKNLDFVHVYNYKIQDGVVLCDIWLQLKTEGLPENFNATFEVRRWKSLAVEANNGHLLPPALYLGNKFNEATEEELTFCSDSVRQSICGKGTSCVKNVCSCMDGFKEIDSTIRSYGSKGRVVRCEDIDECKEGTHKCPDNSKCVNTAGDYFCRCNAGYRKKEGAADEMDKKDCIGLCEAKPCGNGECKLTKENNVDCTCSAGYSGSFCNKKDERLAKASQSTKVVGAVLGTLLGIVIILIIVYIVRQKKNAYSEDFTPAPRVDNAEMIERRPMRGVNNRAYQ